MIVTTRWSCRGLTRLIRDQHDVVPFTSPVEALDAILGGAEPFDAILCDVMMPEMSGIEVPADRRARPDPRRG